MESTGAHSAPAEYFGSAEDTRRQVPNQRLRKPSSCSLASSAESVGFIAGSAAEKDEACKTSGPLVAVYYNDVEARNRKDFPVQAPPCYVSRSHEVYNQPLIRLHGCILSRPPSSVSALQWFWVRCTWIAPGSVIRARRRGIPEAAL